MNLRLILETGLIIVLIVVYGDRLQPYVGLVCAAFFLLAAVLSQFAYQANGLKTQRYVTLTYILYAVAAIMMSSVSHLGRHVPDWRILGVLFLALYCYEQTGAATGNARLFRRPNWKRFAIIALMFTGSLAIGIALIEYFVGK